VPTIVAAGKRKRRETARKALKLAGEQRERSGQCASVPLAKCHNDNTYVVAHARSRNCHAHRRTPRLRSFHRSLSRATYFCLFSFCLRGSTVTREKPEWNGCVLEAKKKKKLKCTANEEEHEIVFWRFYRLNVCNQVCSEMFLCPLK